MNDTERVIGKLEEFRDWAKDELAEIKADIKSLQSFKWRVAGGAGVLAVLLTILVEVFHALRG